MTSHEIVKALAQIKTYVSAADLDAFDYAIKVFELLEEKQIENPLEFISELAEGEK